MSRFNRNFFDKMKNNNDVFQSDVKEDSDDSKNKSVIDANQNGHYIGQKATETTLDFDNTSFATEEKETIHNASSYESNTEHSNAKEAVINNDSSQSLPITEKQKKTSELNLEIIDISEINYAENNPFRINDKSEAGRLSLEELADSIATFGLIHPPTVNFINDKYYLISGERRLEAVKLLGWDKVPCFVISEYNKNKIAGMIYSANLDVRDFSAMQMLEYCSQLQTIYKEMIKNREVTGTVREKVAERLNISERQLAKYTYVQKRLDMLTDEEKEELDTNGLSLNRAYKIIKERTDVDNSRDKTKSNDTDKSDSKTKSSDEENDDDTSKKDDESYIAEETISESVIADVCAIDESEHSVNEDNDTEEDCLSTNDSPIEVDIPDLPQSEATLKNSNNLVGVFFTEKYKPIIFEAETIYPIDNPRTVFGILFADNSNTYILFPSRIKHINSTENGNETIQIVAVPVNPDTIKKKEKNNEKDKL